MQTPFLFHGQDQAWLRASVTELTLTVATAQDFTPAAFFVRCEPDNEEKLIPLHESGSKGQLKLWSTIIPLNQDKATTVYCFKTVTNERQWWLSAIGVTSRVPAREQQFRYNTEDQPPAWVQQQIFYQIFPDRFANGNPDLNVVDNEYHLAGNAKPAVTRAWHEGVSTHEKQGACEFFNGDLHGIRDRIDYLKELGITTLYLNPVFASLSNHKYDTCDYLNVDPHLGSNELLAEISAELHDKGMKIILDGVFNHTSLNHPWFDRFNKRSDGLGAWQNPTSPYRHFYQFDGDSENYIGWNGHKSLPKLNFLNPEVQDYFYAAEDAVIRHWLKPPYNIDGWRLDVIHMLGEGEGAKNNAHYVRAFRQATKAENPETYLLGEHFFEASAWLQGDQEDGAMNYYGFAHPVRAFFTGLDIVYAPCHIDAAEFAAWLNEAAAKIPWQNQLSQLNQLDSHDTMRFLTMAQGNEQTLRNALMMLFCWVGAPCLYYGTEVALEGGQDPDNRRPFPWQRLDSRSDMIEFIRNLTQLRQQSIVLQSGSVQWLLAEGDILAFARSHHNKIVVYTLNRGATAQTLTLPIWQTGSTCTTLHTLNGEAYEVNGQGEITITLASNTATILWM